MEATTNNMLMSEFEELVGKHIWGGEELLHALRADVKALAQKYVNAKVIKPAFDARTMAADNERIVQLTVTLVGEEDLGYEDTRTLSVSIKEGDVFVTEENGRHIKVAAMDEVITGGSPE